MKLQKKISPGYSYFLLFLILLVGLVFLSGFYYIINIQHQKKQTPLSNGPVTTLPKSFLFNLDQPDEDTLSFSSTIIVSGKTEPKKDVLISTEDQDFIIQSKENGSFSTVLSLAEGVNNITVAVFDSKGSSKIAKRTVYYSKEKI